MIKSIELANREYDFDADGSFAIRKIKGKYYLIPLTSCFNNTSDTCGFGATFKAEDVVFMYCQYVEDKYYEFYYSLVDKCILGAYAEDKYESGCELNPKFSCCFSDFLRWKEALQGIK